MGGFGGWGVIAGAGMTVAVANALGTRGAGHKGKVDVILLRDMGLAPFILGSGKSSKCYGAVLKQGLRIAELNHLHAAVTVSTIRKLGSLFIQKGYIGVVC